ncbi:type II toxin-antitoxin system RelE/ParE family toxin [Coraliomargarita sp. W4R53]
MAYLGLSRRALLDIEEVNTLSIEKWGHRVAAEYLQSIENALNLLRENPQLLKAKEGIPDSLCFYRVRQHFLVCAAYENSIFVLTVKHGAMDLPERLAELEPQLSQEAEFLYKAFIRGKR